MNEATLSVPNSLTKSPILFASKWEKNLCFHSITTFNCMRSPGKWIAFLSSVSMKLCQFFAWFSLKAQSFLREIFFSKLWMIYPQRLPLQA